MDSTASKALRALLAGPGLVRMPGVYDGISAHVARQAGFGVVFLTGAGVSASRYGVPDLGLVTASELSQAAEVLVEASGLPVIANADAGFGEILNVTRTVETLERAGVAGIMIEDQVSAKRRCGHLARKQVVPVDEYLTKLHGALAARRAGTLIVARTDALAPLGVDEAIARGRRYAAEGADVVFVEAPESREDVERIAAEIPGVPLVFSSVAGGRTPHVDEDVLERLGYKLLAYPGALLFSAAQAMIDELTGVGGAPQKPITGPRELFEAVGLDRWSALEQAAI